jgi:hypothetical protein
VRILGVILILTAIVSFKPHMKFKSERIRQCAAITLNESIERVFPLFGPMREKEWAEGWDPEIIYANDPLVEEHMIFRTKGNSAEGFYTWVITRFDPEKYRIEYMVSTPNRIWFISIQCVPEASKTKATICYTYTGITVLGDDLNREALKKMYAHDLKDWEEAINYYLQHHKILKNH